MPKFLSDKDHIIPLDGIKSVHVWSNSPRRKLFRSEPGDHVIEIEYSETGAKIVRRFIYDWDQEAMVYDMMGKLIAESNSYGVPRNVWREPRSQIQDG